MKILHLVGTLNAGGIERVVTQLALSQQGNDTAINPSVACLLRREGVFMSPLQDEGISVYDCSCQGSAPWELTGKLFNLIKQDLPDIIHSHVNYSLLWQAIPKIINDIPMVYTQHSISKDVKRLFHRTMSFISYESIKRRKFKHTAVSCFAADYAAKLYPVNREEISVIYNGIDVDTFEFDSEKRLKTRQQFSIDDDEIVIGCVGRLDYVKGYDLLIEAFSIVNTFVPDKRLRLMIVGTGGLHDNLQELSKYFNIADKIIWVGFSDDVPGMLSASDIYVQASRWETLSLTTLEALANGLTVITSNTKGAEEIANYSRNIFIFSEYAPAQAAETIRSHLGGLPRLEVRDPEFPVIFSKDMMVNNYREVYASLLDQ